MIGMMGTGKTTVGALVAEGLVRPFADLDTELMVHTGRTIPELFASGEDRFREMESMVLARLAEGESSVISTGGGAILRQANVDIMKRTGRIILLTAPVQVIADRIGSDPNRPLAAGFSSLEELDDARLATYESAADFAVTTDGKDQKTVAEEVIACSAM